MFNQGYGSSGMMGPMGGTGMMGPMGGMMNPMMGGGMMNPLMGMVGAPAYQQLNVGPGIDMGEYYSIVKAAATGYMAKATFPALSMSQVICNAIKQQIGGEWVVVCCPMSDMNVDFTVSLVKGGDFMCFSFDQIKIQVCRVRNF